MSGHGFHPFHGRISKHLGDHFHAPDDAYLSYYDVRLTREDVNCIKDDWLTDNAISFWEEYLEHETLPAYPLAKVVLLRPSMCFMLIQTPDARSLKDALPKFDGVSHIFLPVNDCRNPNLPEGGSHWSLLVVSILNNKAFHYDSLHPSNREPAYIACKQLEILLGRSIEFTDLETTPQQHNGSDCGIFVCREIKILLEKLLKRDGNADVNMSLRGVEIDAPRQRKSMLEKIERLRKEGKRNQSRSRSRSPAVHRDPKEPPRVGN